MALLLKILPDNIRKPVNIWRYKNFQAGKILNKSSIACFDYYKCIYVHIPKTAGISVNNSLFGNPAGVHKNVGVYRGIFAPKTYQEYFKFTFVRNPWDRLVSAYFFLQQGGKHQQDADWAAKHIKPYSNFEDFVLNWLTKENIYKGLHFIPQVDFISYRKKIDVDYIGRFENLQDDFDIIKQKIGLPHVVLPHKNKSSRDHYSKYYNATTKEIVAKVYSNDISAFNYTFQ